MDAINLISKVDGLPDAPISAPGEFYQVANVCFVNGSVTFTSCVMVSSWIDQQWINRPRVHEYLKEMRREVLSSQYELWIPLVQSILT